MRVAVSLLTVTVVALAAAVAVLGFVASRAAADGSDQDGCLRALAVLATEHEHSAIQDGIGGGRPTLAYQRDLHSMVAAYCTGYGPEWLALAVDVPIDPLLDPLNPRNFIQLPGFEPGPDARTR